MCIEFLHDICAIDAIKITEPFFCDASYNHIGKLGTLMVGVYNGRRDTCIPLCTLLLPLPTTTPTPPLTYYSPGAWSEVTSMVTYVMMTNSLIHYCQSMKHIYMDTVYKLG